MKQLQSPVNRTELSTASSWYSDRVVLEWVGFLEWFGHRTATTLNFVQILGGLKVPCTWDLALATLEKIIFGDRNIIRLPQNLYKSNYTWFSPTRLEPPAIIIFSGIIHGLIITCQKNFSPRKWVFVMLQFVTNWHFSRSFRLIFLNIYEHYPSDLILSSSPHSFKPISPAYSVHR